VLSGTHHRSRLAALIVAAAVVNPIAMCRAGVGTLPARGTYLAGPYPAGPYTFVNNAVGAGIFYDSGFLGSSTLIGNIEAGFIWGDHEVFDRLGLGLSPAVERQVTGTGAAGYTYLGTGIALLGRLWSGAIATSFFSTSIGSFQSTPDSTMPVFRQFFQGISGTACDVINSSFGSDDPATGARSRGGGPRWTWQRPARATSSRPTWGPRAGWGRFPRTRRTPSPADLFFKNTDGTSFASSTVAGGVALMKDVAKGLTFVPGTALDGRVVKAVLMATSAATDGWNNGQASVGV
jgi:hypothetical protein